MKFTDRNTSQNEATLTPEKALRKARLQYSDGSKVKVPAGDHGRNTHEVSAALRLHAPVKGDGSVIDYVVDPIPLESGRVLTREHTVSASKTAFNTTEEVELISFEHSHRYLVSEYPLVAPAWRDQLLAEARIVARSLQGDQALAYEFLERDGSFGAWMVTRMSKILDVATKRDVPQPEEYNALLNRCFDNWTRIKNATAAQYAVLHDAGIEFIHIRFEQDKLNKRVHARVENLIDVSSTMQKAAEEIESEAFWLIDLYGQVVARDPARLFAYRFAVMTVRAAARGTGTSVAGGQARQIFQEAGAVIRAELPRASTALLLGYLKKTFPDPNNQSPMEVFAEKLISLNIFVFFEAIDFFVFEADEIPAEQREMKFIDRLAPGLAAEIVDAIAEIIAAKALQGLPDGSVERKKIERIAAVIPALINSTIREIAAMSAAARYEGRPFHDVFCSEAGGAVIRIVRDCGKALLAQPIREWMANRIAGDSARSAAARQEQIKMWTTIILTLRLRFAPIDESNMKAPTDHGAQVVKSDHVQPSPEDLLPKIRGGPDQNGDAGIAKVRPKFGQTVGPTAAKPPEPAFEERKNVPLVPRQPLRDKATLLKVVGPVGPAYTTEELNLAIKLGDIRLPKGEDRGAHLLLVIVRDANDKEVAKWWEVSHLNVGFPGARKIGHTEQQALARVLLGKVDVGGKVVEFELKPDWRIVFRGEITPCTYSDGCSLEMDAVARAKEIYIDYSDEKTDHQFTPDGRQTKAVKRAVRQ